MGWGWLGASRHPETLDLRPKMGSTEHHATSHRDSKLGSYAFQGVPVQDIAYTRHSRVCAFLIADNYKQGSHPIG